MGVALLRPENIIPYITTGVCLRVSPLTQKTFSIAGINFIPETTVNIPGFEGSIDLVSVLSPTEIELTVTSGPTAAVYDIVIINRVDNTEWIGNGVGQLVVAVSDWIDLRVGGAAFTHGNGAGNDIRYRLGMGLFRDSNGMYFTGLGPWSAWVKFESLWWTRGESKTLQWIFSAPTASMAVGIGSDATDESATSQYNQAEVHAYFSSATFFSSLYGNNGTPGITGYQNNSQILTPWTAFKIKFTADGTAGLGVFTLYGLANISEGCWDDESNVLKTFTIGGTLAPDEPHIMPWIVPRDGGAQRFAALKVT